MASSLKPIDQGSADIRQKRIHIGMHINDRLITLEMEMLKNLNKKHYDYSYYESILGLHIVVSSSYFLFGQFEIDRSVVKSELLDQSYEKFLFEILLDQKFPFNQPQVFCLTPFSQPPLNGGRDLFSDIMKQDWKIAKKLYEIVQYVPEFISDVKITEGLDSK